MSSKIESMRRITVNLPVALFNSVEEIRLHESRKTGKEVTLTDVMRAALNEKVERQERLKEAEARIHAAVGEGLQDVDEGNIVSTSQMLDYLSNLTEADLGDI